MKILDYLRITLLTSFVIRLLYSVKIPFSLEHSIATKDYTFFSKNRFHLLQQFQLLPASLSLVIATMLLAAINTVAAAPPGLNAPGSLSATTISSSAIRLNWSDTNNKEDGYRIERSTSASSGFSVIATTASNTTSYQNNNLSSNTTYYYRVRAFGKQGRHNIESSYSRVASAKTSGGTIGDTTDPNVTITSPSAGTTYTSANTVSINASASDNVGVTQVRFYKNGALQGTDTTAPYSRNWSFSSANNGSHNWTAIAYDAAGNSKTSTAVNLTVNINTGDTTDPNVTITSPASGTTYTSASTVSIYASASDNVGVTEVRFFKNGVLQGTDTTAPYSRSWSFSSANNGSHSWTAVAYDAAGNSKTSSAVNLTVNISSGGGDTTAPNVTITSPASGTTYTSAQTVTLTASASDNVGVTRVDFYKDGLIRAIDFSAPYNFDWIISESDNGNHGWTAKAFDAAGNTKFSSAVNLNVNINSNPGDTTAPSVTITSPASGTTYTNAQTVTVNASASDNVGVTKVEFYKNNTLYGTDWSAPYNRSWLFTDADNGTHSWTARAYDAAGNIKISAGVNLTVNINAGDTQAPTVTISNPVSGTTYTNAQTVTISASASDNVGVTKVEFRQNGALRSTDTSPPYTHYWPITEANDGNHNWTARAFDGSNNSTPSNSVSLTVDIGSVGTEGGVLWSQAIGGTSDDRGLTVAIDNGGDLVITGSFKGTVDFGGGPLTSTHFSWLDPDRYIDIFMAKYSSTSGYHLWSKNFGTVSDDTGYGIVIDYNDNVTITGTSEGTMDMGGGDLQGRGTNDTFLAQFSGINATHRWSRIDGGSGLDYGRAVAVDQSGNVIVTGSFTNQANFGGADISSVSTSSDIFLAKYSSSGNHLWSKRLGGTNADIGQTIVTDSSGNIFVAGYFVGTGNFGGSNLNSAGGYDIFIAKFSSSGQHLWSKRFGGTGSDYPRSIAVMSNGDIVITGYFANTVNFGGGSLSSAGNNDIFVARYTSNGAHQWSKRFGSSGIDEGHGIALDSNDDIVVTGQFSNSINFGGGALSNAGGYDVFVAKLSPSGQHIWSQSFGGSGYDYGRAVAVNGTSGDVAVTGYFQGSADFGDGILNSAGSFDIFLLSLAP